VHVPAETILSFKLERPLDVYPDPGYDRDGPLQRSDNAYGDRNYDDGSRRNDRSDQRQP